MNAAENEKLRITLVNIYSRHPCCSFLKCCCMKLIWLNMHLVEEYCKRSILSVIALYHVVMKYSFQSLECLYWKIPPAAPTCWSSCFYSQLWWLHFVTYKELAANIWAGLRSADTSYSSRLWKVLGEGRVNGVQCRSTAALSGVSHRTYTSRERILEFTGFLPCRHSSGRP